MSDQHQLNLFEQISDATPLLSRPEDQWFDRKSVRTQPMQLAELMVAFANADGGRILVGAKDKKCEGFTRSGGKLADIQQAPLDFIEPPFRVGTELVPCKGPDGEAWDVLLVDIRAGERVHRTVKGKCLLRVGDETRTLNAEQERELSIEKGETQFDATPVPRVSLEDLRPDLIESYREAMAATDGVSLLRNRELLTGRGAPFSATVAGWVLLGIEPPVYSYIRYLSYLGTEIETGTRSNLQKDIRLSAPASELIQQAADLLRGELGTVERLGRDGRFGAYHVIPEFAWLEAIVNAVTHRSYSLQGDGIRIRNFDDRIEVESPGRLPGLVRVKTIRENRYSRNPHLARALAESTRYVRELNEGVPRMFEEMERAGLPPPEYRVKDASVTVTLRKPFSRAPSGNGGPMVIPIPSKKVPVAAVHEVLRRLKHEGRLQTSQIARIWGVSQPTARRYLQEWEAQGLVKAVLVSSTDPTRYWAPTEHPFWTSVA